MTSIQALNISHLVISSSQTKLMTEFFRTVFGINPHYANDEFADFVLPSGTRVAFFNPTGKSSKYFNANNTRDSSAFGITVNNIQEFYQHCLAVSEKFTITFSGPPKDHPWGEPSFLLIDPDGNRWEVTQSPSNEGVLVNKPFK